MKKLIKRIVAMAVGALFALTMLAATPAESNYAYRSADYSYASNSNTRPTICDKTADGHMAYAEGKSIAGTSFRVNDQDQNGGSCWYKTYESGVAWHKTCNDIRYWPDPCGGTSGH